MIFRKRHPELFATIRFHRAATNKWDPLQNPTTSQAIPVRSTLSSACAHKYQNSNGKRPHNSANANEASAYQPEDLNNSSRNSNTFAWMNDENMLFGRIVALRLKSLDSRKRMMVGFSLIITVIVYSYSFKFGQQYTVAAKRVTNGYLYGISYLSADYSYFFEGA